MYISKYFQNTKKNRKKYFIITVRVMFFFSFPVAWVRFGTLWWFHRNGSHKKRYKYISNVHDLNKNLNHFSRFFQLTHSKPSNNSSIFIVKNQNSFFIPTKVSFFSIHSIQFVYKQNDQGSMMHVANKQSNYVWMVLVQHLRSTHFLWWKNESNSKTSQHSTIAKQIIKTTQSRWCHQPNRQWK